MTADISAALAAEAGARFGAAFTPRGRDRFLAAARARQTLLGLAGLEAYREALRADPGEWGRLWPLALYDGGALLCPGPQFEVVGAVLREWAAGAPERTLRALALGCGAFETVSLAITLEEAGFRHKNWQVEICGLDLNPEALARAEAGLFSPGEVAALAPARRRKWFAPKSGGFLFKAALAPPVTLAAGNAYEPETWPQAPFDLIFCRGLTFEAPPEAPGRLAGALRAALAPAGFLFTAPGEFLPDTSLILEERAGVTWYRPGARRARANRFHQPRRVKQAPPDLIEPEPPGLAGPEPTPPAELIEAERLLASGRPDEARDLAGAVLMADLLAGRPAWAAWAFLARWEAALGRPPGLSPGKAE